MSESKKGKSRKSTEKTLAADKKNAIARSILTKDQVTEIKLKKEEGLSWNEIAQMYSISKSTVIRAAKGLNTVYKDY